MLAPKGGARLVTLRDAGRYLSQRFATVTKDAALEQAIRLLMQATESGALTDRKTATDQVAIVLRSRALL